MAVSQIDGERILITGGTGSLGTHLTGRLLSGWNGEPKSVTIFSRDELKQSEMRAAFPDKRLRFVIGDVKDRGSIELALMNVDIVFNTAAMKRVEVCQRWPAEAIKTNCLGTINIIEAIQKYSLPIKTVVGVSSDKGVKPVNIYGTTKFLQEQIILAANEDLPNTRLVSVCYGNVVASRGSVVPLFQAQIKAGGPVTVRDLGMTRFLISLDQAVDTLLDALEFANRGEIYVPIIPAARVVDIATVLIGDKSVAIQVTQKGVGEKMDEVLISEEDACRTIYRSGYYVVTNEIQRTPAILKDYISKDNLLSVTELKELFIQQGII
jgi:FlaA1/EpsC-like NDP-sugar epimerase